MPQKYKGIIAISVFCIFCLILFLANDFKAYRSISLIKTVLLIPILSYFMTFYAIWHMSYNVIKCHKMAFYDILWQMIYDMKCHKVCQYGYQKNRLDQTNWSTGSKIICQKQNQTENAKNWNGNISFVFLRRFLYNFQRICGSSSTLKKRLKLYSMAIK